MIRKRWFLIQANNAPTWTAADKDPSPAVFLLFIRQSNARRPRVPTREATLVHRLPQNLLEELMRRSMFMVLVFLGLRATLPTDFP